MKSFFKISFLIISLFMAFACNSQEIETVTAPSTTTKTPANSTELCFPTTCVQLETAETDEERRIGLMYRESLPENTGMIFIFENEAKHGFWMKNTLIPLDMIWLNKDMEIVHIEHATPCKTEQCPTYSPSTEAKYVIELNSGFTEKHNIKIGDKVDYK